MGENVGPADVTGSSRVPHMSHWGGFDAESRDGEVVAVHPYAQDPDPSPLLGNIPGSIRHPARITQPMVRRGWLEGGPGRTDARGADPYLPVDWDEAADLLGRDLRRVIDEHGPQAIFGGSYGWASAGRFHHAQSQIHRFLNCLGGYTRSVNTYSLGASQVILPHVLGSCDEILFDQATTWPVIMENTEMLVAFGGISVKNSAVAGGGLSRHTVRGHLDTARRQGMSLVSISPIRDDLDSEAVEWVAVRPGTDVAVMAALAFVLAAENLHDVDFLARHCVGYERFERYLFGLDDGVPKTPEWAEAISSLPAEQIRQLARRMATRRTLVTVSWSLQRIEHGEQPVWMGIVLAAMLGQIGLPGGGFGHGYGSSAAVGMGRLRFGLPRLSQGRNPVDSFIPVARVADMLLDPGGAYDYNGERRTYPDIRLVYWAGGNPFHHHQDIARLRRALARAETIVVHEPYWTPMARHADIVLPCTTTLERDDIGGMTNDSRLVAMKRAVPPYADARDDYAIFAAVAERLGVAERFTAGRDAGQWLVHMYEQWREQVAAPAGTVLPPFDDFWARGELELPTVEREVLLADFRADPYRSPLPTPSGRIEIFSATIASFGYDDCPGHPTWLEPTEWLGADQAADHPLHLLANQPRTRLHSQLDHGATSQASKVRGREPVRIHPRDAAARGIADGDVVRVFNRRGSLLAGARLSDGLRRGVVQLSTGAWYDPLDPADVDAMCVHGNPNVLTTDRGTSRLAQGCTGAHVLVQIERYDGPLPPIRIFSPPPLVARSDDRPSAPS